MVMNPTITSNIELSARPQTITVVVIDRSEVFARGIGALVDDVSVEAFTSDVTQGVDLADSLRPQVILLDTDLLDRGFKEFRSLVAHPGGRVILMSSSVSPTQLSAALASGANGCLRREVPAPVLVSHIRDVAAGGQAFDEVATGLLINRLVAPTQELSEVEIDALRLIADGCRFPDLCKHMAMSESTAKRVLRKALAKLGAENRAQAVALAVRQGLI